MQHIYVCIKPIKLKLDVQFKFWKTKQEIYIKNKVFF